MYISKRVRLDLQSLGTFHSPSTAAKIAALEAKLKQMDEESLTPSVTKKPRLMTHEHRHKNKITSDVKIIHRPSKKHSNRTTQKYRSNF